MPRIDPQQLLKTLGILLSPHGGIKSSEEVDRLVKLMSKFSRKLVSKCIYVQILQATDYDLLGHFLAEGGWTLLNSWFDDSIKGQNWPLVKEMCVLFMKCPMTAQLLKENAEDHQAPRIINQIRVETSIRQDIRSLASQLYKSWVDIVSQDTKKQQVEQQQPAESSGPVFLLQSLADEVAESLKDEEEKEAEISFKRKIPTVMKPKSNIIDGSIKINKKNLPSSHPLMNKENKKEKSKDKTKDREKEKEKEKEKEEKEREKRKRREAREKEEKERNKRFRPDPRDEVNPDEKQRIKDLARKMKEDLAKKDKKSTTVSSLPPKLPKIPKKQPSSSTEDKKSGLSFEAMLGGLDNKPKTVKTPMIKNKTAALLEGMQQKNSSSNSKSSSSSSSKSSSSKSKDSSSSRSSDRDSSSRKSEHRDHRDRDRDHHSSPSSKSSSKNDKKLQLTIPSPEAVNKKKESESPKSAKSPSTKFAESSSFMDDIFSSMGVNPPRKQKKRRNSESKDESGNGSKSSSPHDSKKAKTSTSENESPQSATTESSNATPAFSFYKDTLDVKEEAKEEPKAESSKSDNDRDNSNDNSKENSPKLEETTKEEELPFEEPDAMPREVKGILVYHRGREKRDKRIKWRPETQLVEVQYFEVDENERVNVNKIKFENLREFESQMEKAAMRNKGDISDAEDLATIPWYKPRPILVTNREPFTPGNKSVEKEIQANREKGVLQALYFSKDDTPNTPKEAEPDVNSMKVAQPAFIPMEDREADEDSEYHYKNGWPEPKINQVSQQSQIESQFSLPPALSSLLSSMSKDGLDKFLPSMTTISNLSQQEQDTLAAQTAAMRALGVLPMTGGGPGNVPNFPPNNGMPPPMNMNNPPPNQVDFSRMPPNHHNSNNGFPAPPPFGGMPPNGPPNGPPSNGFYNQPPPFGGPNNRNNGRNDYHRRDNFNNRGGDNYNRGGGYHRNGGPPHRGGYHRDFSRRDDSKIGTRPCKFYVQKGYCREGDSCRFIHDQSTARVERES